jgi:hypothetical protein
LVIKNGICRIKELQKDGVGALAKTADQSMELFPNELEKTSKAKQS